MAKRRLEDLEGFGERLRRAMDVAGKSVPDLVNSGVWGSKGYDMVYGTATPSLATLDRICRELRVSADYLLGYSAEMQLNPGVKDWCEW